MRIAMTRNFIDKSFRGAGVVMTPRPPVAVLSVAQPRLRTRIADAFQGVTGWHSAAPPDDVRGGTCPKASHPPYLTYRRGRN